MKNARNNGQIRVKNCLKWTASGLLLALMFVLVFAGTLSGAFGIENELQQNGIIQSNVASAVTSNSSTKSTTVTYEELSISGTTGIASFTGAQLAQYWENSSIQSSTGYTFVYNSNNKNVGWLSAGFKGTGTDSNKAYTKIILDGFSVTGYKITWTVYGYFKSANNGSDNQYMYIGVKDNANDGSYAWTGLTDSNTTTSAGSSGNWDGFDQTYGYYYYRSGTEQETPMICTRSAERTVSLKNAGTIGIEFSSHWYNNRYSSRYMYNAQAELRSFTIEFYGVVPTPPFSGGDGTIDSPYILANRDDFDELTKKVNTKGMSFDGKYFKVQPDTSISGQNATTIAMGGTHFTPIGNSTTKFAGTLLGNGCTINGLVTNGQYSGLFGYVNNAHIENLTVNVSNDSGNTSAGGLVGVVNGTTTITNCNVSGTVKGTHQIGGFVGFAQDCVLTISNGNNSATITTTGQYSDDKGRTSGGGIVGYVNKNATVTINDVTNTGEVKTESSSANSGLGGIVGFANGGTNINNCHNTASITGRAGLGGIVGYTANGSIVGCRNDGNITSSEPYDLGAGEASYSGGIAGYCYADVAKCYNSGTVKTTGDWGNSNIVGGIVGYLGEGRNVKYCYNGGWIEGSDYVGGIVGKRAGTVSYSYQAGTIKGLYKKTSTIGHITGNDTSEISTCWTLPSASNATTVTNTFNHNGWTVNSETGVVVMKPAFGNAVLGGWDDITVTGATSGTFGEITGIDQFVFYPNNDNNEIKNNEYLFAYATNANAVALVPNHIDSGVEAINGSTTASVAKTVPFVSRFYFNASSDKNLVASISPIDAPLTSTQTVYNGSGQKVTTDVVGADIQEKSYYFTSGNGNALAKSEFIDAGEYDIVTEVTMKVGENTYVVVGRQVRNNHWTIAQRKISFWNKVYYYGETPTNDPVPQTMSGDEGLLNGHIFTCTYANDLTYDFMYGAIPNAKKEVTINMTGEIRDAAGNDVTYNYDFQNGTFTISMREGNFGVKGTTDIVNNPWGSQGNPFVIKTAQHLVNLSKIVNGDTPNNADTTQIVNSIYNSNQYTHIVNNNTRTYRNCYFIIVNDIDMTGSGFVPIGKNKTYFFEGNVSGVTSIEDTSQQNRFISNLTVNLASTDNVGLFGYVRKTGTETPYIKHIVLNNSCSFVGKSNVGSIAGWAQDAIIQNCINNATVEGKGENAGGIVGKNFGTETSNCENHGTVNGVKNVGGIAGMLDWGGISNVQNSATVEASGENCGGIVGYMISYSTLKDVTNNAQVNGNHKTGGVLGYYEKKATDSVKPIYGLTNNNSVEGLSNVGGIIGCVAGDLTFDGNNENQKCTMSGASVKGTFNVGGLVGGVENNSTLILTNFTNNANVIGGYAVGGLVGLLRGSITSSVNQGNITSEKDTAGTPSGLSKGAYVGGIVGVAYGTISHCYNSGNISASGDNSDFLGGIVGYTNSNVSFCTSLANSSISGSNQVGGIAGKLQNATIDHCYFNGTIVGIWNDSRAKLDFICGEIIDGLVSNSWKLPNAQNGDTGNRAYTNAGNALTIADGVTFTPYFVQEGSEHDTEWEQIVSKDIVGFSVSGNVPTNSYFNSDNGNDTAYVKPDKTSGFAVNNTSGDVKVWYGADFGSDVRCSIVEIQIDTTADEYNGNVQGLTREDVHMPSANNGVYAVQFAYKGNKYGDVIPEDVDVYNTTVTVKIDEKVVGVRTGVQYEITKKKVTITNIWTWKFVNGSNADFYKFEYNKDIQGMLSITVDGVLKNSHYTLTQANNQAAAGKYSSSVVISDRDYEVEIVSKYCTIQNNNANLETDNAKYGIKTTQTNANTSNSQTTYTYNWEIVPFDLAADFNKNNVWFGGTTNLIVGNQGIANVKVGNTNKGYYPLQADKKGTGVQQVLVYAQHNYAADNFVLYVKYNNNEVVELTRDTEYTVGTLDTSNNTVGTFYENVVSLNNPVKDTNVTASGTGNFSGIVTKYYTALHSDFGWKDGKTPEDNDWGGSADNPYVISTPEHLLRLSQIVNGGKAWNSIQNTVTAGLCIAPQGTAVATDRAYSGAYFLVTADIDMTGNVSTDGVYNFLPIGHRNEQSQTDMPFSGTFDGNGKAITFVYNTENFGNGARVDYVGLFGYLNGATVTDLIAKSIQVNGIKGRNYVGGIVGYAENSHLVNVQKSYGDGVVGENYVGGVVGYAENTLISCNNDTIAECNVTGAEYVGGIVGKWIVTEQTQIGGSDDGQARITPGGRNHIIGTKYVGGLFGWLDMSGCEQSMIFKPQFFNEGLPLSVTGTEYVGALFGVVVGNGYHQSATQGKYTAIVISDQKVNNITLQTNTNAKVVGGLVGYAESVGILFETDWNTSSTTFTLDDSTSFFGGVVGVLGKNSTIEAIIVTKEGDGSYLTGSEHTILNNTALGASGKPIGSFVGGIVGYVSSQAGTYWEANTTIFGNGISLVNSGQIHATGYAGGIFGALGDLSTSVAQTFENDTNSILYNVLTTGVRSGNANTTLGIAPTVDSAYFIGAKGKLVNNASLSVTDGYVGGIAGYSGAKVRFVLRNTPQTGAFATENLNVYSGGNDIYINGSYAGGIAGYLVDNLEHELQYIVVQAKFDSANATRVGGLVGYMGSGKVENCVVTNGGNSNVNELTDTFKGSEYVGGLVGETQNAIIRNSVSTGFNLAQTTNTKGGVLGGGTNPTIESSWTFYIANSGATYSTVSKNTYGKYILVDTAIVTTNGSSYPSFENLCGFAGIAKNGTAGMLEFAINVPTQRQLAFYNASGSDVETSNKDSFKGFENRNNVLTIKLDMASGTSMQICVVDIEFVNVPQHGTDNDEAAHAVVESTYKKPSNSTRYHVDVTQANFDIANTKQVTHIKANIYFDYDGDGHYISIGDGNVEPNNRIGGEYDSEEIIPGSSAENPLTISSQEEWNDFAWSIYTGANDYSGQYVKLLARTIVIDTGENKNGKHKGTKFNYDYDFTSVSTPNKSQEDTKNANSNMGYNFAGNISQGSSEVEKVTVDGVLGAKTPSFKGHFDGNGNTIEITYTSGGYHRISVFPNAAGATFKHLTIKGTIQAASQADGKGNEENDKKDIVSKTAAYDIAGFVGKPFGTLKFYNCKNEADIIGLRNVGGIVGYNAGGQSITLEACVNTGDITSLQGSYTLGGKNSDTYNYDDGLNGTGVGETNVGYTFGTGGIIGSYIGNIQIESCRNSGKIIGGHNVGGIIGLHNGKQESFATLTINNCANTGDILANSGYWGEDQGGAEDNPSRGVRQSIFGYAGGLVGKTSRYSSLKMFASYNMGTVITYSNIVGGLVGAVGALSKTSKNTGTDTLLTGSKSVIAYCYNNGTVHSGGTYPKQVKERLSGRENYGGTISGGIAGIVGNIKISNCYNTGDIIAWGVVGYSGSWQLRSGGIVGQSEPTGDTYVVEFETLYNAGSIMAKAKNTHVGVEWIGIAYYMNEKLRYGGAISGYCDHSEITSRITSYNVYSIKYPVGTKILKKDINSANKYKESDYAETDFHEQRRGDYLADGGVAGIGASQEGLTVSGTTFDSYEQLTARLNAHDDVVPRATEYTGNNKINIIQSIETLTEGIDYTQPKIDGKMYDGWIYVYGCLPQLAMFALDTQNGLSMHSVGYRKDQYGEYNATGESAGSDQYPYIIKDGIDLMGMQALVDNGFDFNGKIIEFANSTNNLSRVCSETIVFPTTSSTSTNLKDSNAYKAKDSKGNYHEGKSYHLFAKGALCNQGWSDDKGNVNSVAQEYGTWIENNYRNLGESKKTTLNLQNFIAIGRKGNSFKGTINGQQGTAEASFATIIDSLRVTIKGYKNTHAGLFSTIEDAIVQYVGVGGNSQVFSHEKVGTTVVATAGGIVGMVYGNSVVENCIVKGSTVVGAYGANAYAGGIVGMADPKQGNTYNAGITTTIRNCSISSSGRIESAKSNIGGVLGYVGGDAGASGKGNSVRIEGCEVQKAAIQAANSAKTSSHIGGVLGYGSEYVAAFITGCKVGNGADTVTIKGEHSLGGIAGGMSNAKGGYIDSCIVGEKTTIERIDQGNDNSVAENSASGTAIGGLVGFTEDSTDTTSPLTTTFSGTSKFLGTINVTVGTTNPGEHGDKKPVGNVGGIVGDMGSGANFASGSDVTVVGTINITLAAANVGGVAGRTNTAMFIGNFVVKPNMQTDKAENVGGFIGKNVGTVYILADTTERIVNDTLNGTNITIGGKIQGTSEVGGFIGVNNSGSTLNIGSNVANAKPYRSGTLSITIAEGAEISGSGNHVGGIVGKNEGAVDAAQNDYATIDIVKGTIVQNGTISGKNYVGGIIGLNAGLLTTGGGEADEIIGGIALDENQIGLIKNLSITNKGNVKGGTTENNQYVGGDCVGGVIGKLDAPQTLRPEHMGKGDIAGAFENSGSVEGNRFVGGSLGYVGKYVNIATKGGVNTLFVNTGNVTAHSTFVGGSIGAIVGQITGAKVGTTVNFENQGTVNGLGYVGGSIGVLAGPAAFAQFVNKSTALTIEACNSVGGSVGYIGMPDALKTILNTYFDDNTYSNGYITVKNVHFEASGNLTANPSDDTVNAAKNGVADNDWGGVGGAIGVLGRNQLAKWENNTYYANGNVIAQNVNNVGGIIGLINANDITIGNLLAYNITVTGAKNVGGIVGATTGAKTVINSAYTYAPRDKFTATATSDKNVGGIIGAPAQDTVADTSYWILGCNNADIAGYDIKNLTGLGFSTGTEKTGWYFLYATDANGTNGLGTINTNHQGGGEIELKYWKRIANAYTAQERADKIDTQPLDPPSDIVSGGQPQHATLYATATAASVNGGYYLYTATSNNDVTPTIVSDAQKYFISVTTNAENADEAQQKAGNVAVFYRRITKGDNLKYNGYNRNAVVGMDGVNLHLEEPKEGDVFEQADRNKYFYTTSTNAEGEGAVGSLTADPGTYKSTIKIYLVDNDGKANSVGGIENLEWKIDSRELTVKYEGETSRPYGSVDLEDNNKRDKTITITNIAPNFGKGVPIKIVIKVGNDTVEEYTWTWNNDNATGVFTATHKSPDVKLIATAFSESGDTLSTEDQAFSINMSDTNLYKLECALKFVNAKNYTIEVVGDNKSNPRYTVKTEGDSSLNVTPVKLTLKIMDGLAQSQAFDGKAKETVWVVDGFKYNDGIQQFVLFDPSFNVKYKDNVVRSEKMTSGNMQTGVTIESGPMVQATHPIQGKMEITLSNAIKGGDYYLTFAKTSAGNYTLDNQGSSFSIAETTIAITCDKNGQSKTYDQTSTELTFTFTASVPNNIQGFEGIANYSDFLSEFFKINGKEIDKNSIETVDNKTAKVTLSTDVNAKRYSFTFSKGAKYDDHIRNCAHTPTTLPTYVYTITPRPLTLTTTLTEMPNGASQYTYNTSHQGLSKIKVDNLVANDTIGVTIKIGTQSATVELENNNAKDVTDKVSTIDAGTYSVSFALSTNTSYPQNENYTLTATDVTWKIDKYKIMVGEFNIGANKTYNAEAEVPKINVTNSEVSGNGTTFNYGTDTFTLEYSVSYNGKPYAGNKLVNAGTYKINIGTSNGKIIAKHSDGTDASDNYEFGNSATEHPYVINPCPIEIVWNIKSYVYNESKQMLQISGIKIEGNDILVAAQPVDRVKGLRNDTLTFSRSGGGINVGTNHTTNAVIASVSGKNDEVDSIVENYTIKAGGTSGVFAITPSKLKIFYAGGTTSKVYDAGFGISGKPFVFNTQSQNGGAHGTSELFDISYVYKDKNVGNDKEVVFTYVLKQNANYEYVGTGTESQNKGQITPAHIKVALDKLRSGKATRTFTNEPYYGGKDGASGGKNDGKSTVYRSGEGFRISGVFGNDDIKVVAKYAETGDDRAMFDKYVNDIVKIDEKTFAKAAAGTHLKMLVFEMTGGDAKNYTFNVYNKLDTDGKKYSEKDSTAGDKQTVTVYDTSDKANGHQNASGADTIHIEITVKTYKVEYTNTAQSYANADNTYNTNWERVGVSNNPPGVTVTVSNGWMYADGQDHGDDEQAEKKVYKAYTTIRGSQNSVRLGAKISGIDGMELNYKMVNQPILTIGYFVVDNNDVFEIGSASSLMIASYYWWVAQNGQNPDFNLPLVATSTWHKIVSNDDYMTKPFEKPSDAPNDVDMTGWDWDMYFAWFEQQNDVKIFLNETGISNEDGTWGYYTTGEESQKKQYTKYRMVRDFSGKLTESDIAILAAFFPQDKGWGVGKTYLDNFLNTSAGSVLTAVGSVFRWYNGSVGQFEFDGNGYVIEYLNIMGYGKENVGLFDIIGANGIVKNLHLRNITINANQGNVGGIAGSIAAAEGDADATKNVTNVSFHGKITATGGTVGGLFGTSARAIDGAIVLGEISATGANAGGVVGTATADLTKVVSMMQITASGDTVGAFTSNNAHVGEDCKHMANAVWKKDVGFVNVEDKNVGYNDLMSGSNSLYANGTSDSGTYDVISETFADSGQNVNPRQSKRLRDMVSVYLLMYSLSANGGTYTISASSWLVGTADGTTAKPIVIANKQNVSLLRELRFAAFVLKANVSIEIASTFSGAFYGSVTSENGKDYKITCNKQMFEAYATEPTVWLVTPTQP